MGFLEWLTDGGSAGEQRPVHSFDQVLADGRPDPWTELMFWADHPAGRWRMHLGKNPTHWVKSEERRQVLVLGPPQSDKTTSVIVPLIMSSPGPVVSTSTKPDVWQATAQTRARMGNLWHFAVDGSPTLPGCTQLRWSPIEPSLDWAVALMLGTAMAETSGMTEHVTNAPYFKSRAADVIASLLHAAAIGKRDMRWMLRAVALHMATLREAQEDLYDSDDPDSVIAADLLAGLVSLDSRSRDSIFSTASTAFAAYRVPGALATTLNPNFDPADFVAGDPHEINRLRWSRQDWQTNDPRLASMGITTNGTQGGLYDTIFICASSEVQNLVAPIVVGLLSRITAATYAQHASDQHSGVRDRRPVFFVLDEVANVAPMGELPSMLSQAAGQGLLICACLQDLTQARSRWRDHADGFLTLFGNVLVFPGIRDERTLKLISELTGKYWHTTTSESHGQTDGKGSYNTSVSEQLVDVLTPSDIAAGRDALNGVPNQDRLLLLYSEGWCYCFSTPYYRDHFFQTLLLCNAAAPWRLQLPVDHLMFKAPLPLLARDGNTRWLHEVGGAARVQWFHEIQQWHGRH